MTREMGWNKRRFFILLLALCMLLTVPACAESFDVTAYSYEELVEIRDAVVEKIAEMDRQYAIENGNRKIIFEEEAVQLLRGRTQQLSPSVERVVEEAPAKTQLVYSSSDPEVAKVSNTGLITAVSVGEAVITCSAKDDELVFSELPVAVVETVAGVTLDQDTAALLLKSNDPAAAKLSLTATVAPENAFWQTVVWTSSDETVATVDANGHVKAIAPGSATITATSEEEPAKGQKVKSASCKVTVGQAVEKIEFEETFPLLAANSSVTLKASVLPENATSKKIVWESSNPEVLSVSEKGVIKGLSCGMAEVICRAADESGTAAKFEVQVYQRVTGLKLNLQEGTLLLTKQDEGLASKQLKATVEPQNALNKEIIWTSSDRKIAVVDENGAVKALAPGKVTITATSADSPGKDQNGKQKKPYSASCTFTVGRAVDQIRLSNSTLLLNKGKSTTLKATVLPSDASNKNYTWKSSNPQCVTVNAKGQVSAKACGSARVICTAKDGSGVQAVCEVRVIQMVTSMKPPAKPIGITKGKTRRISVQLSPSDATTKKLRWSSSNPNVASVDENGTVTAHKTGQVTITVSTTDGSNISKKITVAVEPVNSVYVGSISWKAMLGIVKKSLSVEATNTNSVRTVKGFDFIVKCTDSYGYTSTNYLSWEGKQIRPGKSLNDRYQKGLSGFEYARKLEVTITTIYFTDGTSETIPSSERYTSTFRF